MTKVLHILNELKFSGAEVMLKSAKNKFEESKITTEILSTGNILGEYKTEFEKCGYRIHHIPFVKSIGFILAVRKLIKNEKYDVVHIHSERFFFFYILIAKSARVSTIVRTIHSTFIFNGFLAIRRKFLLRIGHKLGCQYTSISKNVRDNEKKLNGIDSTLINNWIDTDNFTPLEKNPLTKNDTIKLISIGACSHVKQHFHILNLVAYLKKINIKVEYNHIGKGELEEEEQKQAKLLSIEDSVNFLGSQNNIIEYLHRSDFFLMPSSYEGLGNACVEAMSTGLIPIVNDVPGLRDLVENDTIGYVVKYEDTETVANKIIDLVNTPEKQSYFKENARKKVLNLYSLNNIRDLIQIYESSFKPTK